MANKEKKKPRSAAQKAATKKMQAASPHGKKKGKTKKNPSDGKKKGHKGHTSRNPLSKAQVKSAALMGLALGLGALVVEGTMQLLVPPAYRTGFVGAGVRVVGSVVLGAIASRVKVIAGYANSIRNGGIAVSIFALGAEKLLPMLPTNVVASRLLPGAAPSPSNAGAGELTGGGTYVRADAGVGQVYVKSEAVGSIGAGGIGNYPSPWGASRFSR